MCGVVNVRTLLYFGLVLALPLSASVTEDDYVDPGKVQAYIQYASLSGKATIKSSASITVRADGRTVEFPAGEYTFEATEIKPAPKRFHVFPKTFQPNEQQEMDAYMDGWRSRGYEPMVKTFGLLYRTEKGRTLDNRVHWVSLARFDTEKEAQALVNARRAGLGMDTPEKTSTGRRFWCATARAWFSKTECAVSRISSDPLELRIHPAVSEGSAPVRRRPCT